MRDYKNMVRRDSVAGWIMAMTFAACFIGLTSWMSNRDRDAQKTMAVQSGFICSSLPAPGRGRVEIVTADGRVKLDCDPRQPLDDEALPGIRYAEVK